MADISSVDLSTDISLRELLESKGISARGLAYAESRFAQVCALPLDQVGVQATQREVCSD